MRAVLVIAVLLLSPIVAAGEDIYRSTDAQGNPVFSDQPPTDGGEPMTLKPLVTVPASEVPAAIAGQPDAATSEPVRYQRIEIIYPPDGQAVRHNGGMVPFRVRLEPEGKKLGQGDQVQILLDGTVRGAGANTQISISPVDRGAHTVRARIIDATGAPVVVSPPVHFNLLRVSLGNNGNTPSP